MQKGLYLFDGGDFDINTMVVPGTVRAEALYSENKRWRHSTKSKLLDSLLKMTENKDKSTTV